MSKRYLDNTWPPGQKMAQKGSLLLSSSSSKWFGGWLCHNGWLEVNKCKRSSGTRLHWESFRLVGDKDARRRTDNFITFSYFQHCFSNIVHKGNLTRKNWVCGVCVFVYFFHCFDRGWVSTETVKVIICNFNFRAKNETFLFIMSTTFLHSDF